MTLDINSITVGNDPVIRRGVSCSVYDKLFAPLQPGMCLRVPGEHAGTVAKALSNYLKKHKKKDVLRVSLSTKYPGAKKGQEGRVWLLPKEDQAQDAKKLKAAK